MRMKRRSYKSKRVTFKNHRHRVSRNMKGLTSIPVRYRGRRM